MPKVDEPVWVVDPNGTLGTVPFGQLQSAQQSGYSVATNAQVAQHEAKKAAKREATEGFLGGVNTVVERVANAATLGGADYLASKITPEVTEAVKARKDTDLGKYSELAADVGLVALTGGGSAAAKVGAAAAKQAVKLGLKEAATLAAEQTLAKAGQTVAKRALLATPLGATTAGAEALGGAVKTGAQALLGESRLAQTAARGLGAATEGGALGGAAQLKENISEASLGNEELTAERLLASVGKGALLGAALGGSLPVGADLAGAAGRGALRGARAVGKVATDAMDPSLLGVAGEALSGIAERVSAGVKSAAAPGKSQSILEKAGELAGGEKAKFFSRPSLRADYIKRDEVLDELAADIAPRLERAAQIQSARRVASEVATDIDTIARQVPRGPEVWGAAQTELAGLARDLQEMAGIKGMRAGTGATIKRAVRDISKAASGEGDEAALFVALDEARQRFARVGKLEGRVASDAGAAVANRIDALLQDEAIWGQAARLQKERLASAAAADESRVLSGLTKTGSVDPKALRGQLAKLAHGDEFTATLTAELGRERDALVKAIEAAPAGEKARLTQELAELGEVQGRLQQHFERISDVNDMHRAVVDEARGQIPGGAFAGAMLSGLVTGSPIAAAAHLAVNAMNNPASLAARIGTLENLAQKVGRAEWNANNTVEKIVRVGRNTQDSAGQLVRRLPAEAGLVGSSYGAKDERKDVERKLKLLKKTAEDPQLVMAQAQRFTAGMPEAAPAVTTAVVGKYIRQVQHLQSVAPVVPQSGGVQDNADATPEIPDSAILSMGRRIDAATNANAVHEQLQRGEVHSDALETANAVWPEHMSDMNRRIIAKLVSDKPASYEQLLRLSAVTRAPLAATMSPKFIRAQQGMHDERAERMKQLQQQPKPPQAGAPSVAAASANTSDQIAAGLHGGGS